MIRRLLLLGSIINISIVVVLVGAWYVYTQYQGRVLALTDTPEQREFSWTAPSDFAPGTYTLALAATDNKGATTEKEVSIVVESAQLTEGTVLRLVPSAPEQVLGREFTVAVKLDAPRQAVVAALVEMSYSANVEFVRASVEGSVLSDQIIAPIAQDNTLRFVLASFDGAFQGRDGNLMVLTFRAAREGEATLTISQGASQAISSENPSNVLERVESLVMAIARREVCLALRLPIRGETAGNYALEAITVEVVNPTTGAVISTITTASDSTGKMLIADQAFIAPLNMTDTYTVRIKPPGFAPVTLSNITTILDAACRDAVATVWGDFNGDGVLATDDLNRAIGAYKGAADELVLGSLGKTEVSLIDIVRLIVAYQQQNKNSTRPAPLACHTS